MENSAVDYQGFSMLVEELAPVRSERLISLDTFLQFSQEKDTIILDARSADAYAAGHIDGAINLAFADFTQGKLDNLLGDKNRRILIYCNNNFTDNIEPVLKKRVELALNIPTFINLYGYGYENIYELNETISINDPRIAFTAADTSL
ncbi:rhodanese-like domain-containing protein [Hyphococcus sp.]|uniref:rhodanese-like domain-containing protein n=1 Tax=Hyphococcus sp. TaxID=2038636 RepID=UPI003CCBEA5A